MTRRLEVLFLLPLALAHALLARLLFPAPSRPPQVLQACSAASRAPAVAPPPLRVVELRALARARGIRTAGSRPIASARRADLLGCLGYDSAACN